MSHRAVEGSDPQETFSHSENEISMEPYLQTSIRHKGTATIVSGYYESSPESGSWVFGHWKVTPRVLFPTHAILDQPSPPHFGNHGTGVLAEAFDGPDENIFKQHVHAYVPQAAYVSTLGEGPKNLTLQPQELTPKPHLSAVEPCLILLGDSCDNRNLACEISRLTNASDGGSSSIHSSTGWNQDTERQNLYRELMLEFEFDL